jgi:acylphosphatase
MSGHRTVHLFISGRVQGVWFRGSMQEKARRLGLAGWARNLPDGRVEALVEGKLEAVEAILAWAGTGPAGARVDSVEASKEPEAGLDGFEIR